MQLAKAQHALVRRGLVAIMRRNTVLVAGGGARWITKISPIIVIIIFMSALPFCRAASMMALRAVVGMTAASMRTVGCLVARSEVSPRLVIQWWIRCRSIAVRPRTIRVFDGRHGACTVGVR